MTNDADAMIAAICGQLHERLPETIVTSQRWSEDRRVTLIRIDRDDQFLQYPITDTEALALRSPASIVDAMVRDWQRPWSEESND